MSSQPTPGPPDHAAPDYGQMPLRRFGRINWLGTGTLAAREIRRFMTVWQQTVLAPLITAGLFVVIFVVALGRGRGEVMGLPFVEFIGPGILMMTVIQTGFANSSSSLISAKMQGNIIDTLMPPLSAAEILAGYLAGSLVRSLMVAAVISAGLALVVGHGPAHPLLALLYIVLGALLLGGLGILGGIIAQKFDHMATLTNFVVTPLSFLSGTFYSVQALPEPFRTLSHWNPIFYLIDGARYGFAGVGDAPVLRGLAVSVVSVAAVNGLGWWWLRTGYRMKP